jgi:hypothetical protein
LLTNSTLARVWEEACRFDESLKVSRGDMASLRAKFVPVRKYSRHEMFSGMARSEVTILSGAPISARRAHSAEGGRRLIDALLTRLSHRTKARVRVGPAQRIAHLPARQVVRRWTRGRAMIGVTDFHIRQTSLYRLIDTKELTFFNSLIGASADLARQEMLTLVLSSTGSLTDSHSDDTDGSNHCFLGSKLWLAWDSHEGMQAGLQDVERQDVYDRAAFSMSTFLRLPSSRWFLVSAGQTLFLPGNLTHKVLTLRPYVGVGSFYVGLPDCLHSLTRWLIHGALWAPRSQSGSSDRMVDEVARITLRIAQQARSNSAHQSQWGYPYMRLAYRTWRKSQNKETRDRVAEHREFRALMEIAKSA